MSKNIIKKSEVLEDLNNFLTAYGEGNPSTVSLANSCGLLVCQLVRNYTKHLENKDAEETVEHWGPEMAQRAAWNFTNWVNANRFDGPLNASEL